jgi:hypothetical protein
MAWFDDCDKVSAVSRNFESPLLAKNLLVSG